MPDARATMEAPLSLCKKKKHAYVYTHKRTGRETIYLARGRAKKKKKAAAAGNPIRRAEEAY